MAEQIGRRVLGVIGHDVANAIKGRIVCSDSESLADTMIRLDDGRLIDATKCQYTFES